MVFEIVIDTGGTFTDAVLMDEDRSIRTAKFLTDASEPANSIMGCIDILADQLGLTEQDLLAKTSTLVIGTTLSTNCVLERKGAKCCLLCTKGFKDIPELGEKVRHRDIYNLKTPPPTYLIPRYLRFGVEERTLYDGQILTPLNEADVREAVRKAKAQDVEVPVICFLHSYSNPEHEEKAAELIRDDYPDVVVSSHILRRWMQYYRLSTAELAAYVKPTTARFVRSLDKRMKDSSFKGTSLFVTCAGGVTTPELCLDNPTLLIGSGPAAGPLLGKFLAELAGFKDVIVLDVGGTSSDLALLPDLTIAMTTQTTIGEFTNATESVDVGSIGAGGGSIARLDDRNILYVGPASAGADPGPVCYGKGGELPAVTDADVVLGHIPADYFLGGTMSLDVLMAGKAIEETIAKPLGLNVAEAAAAISSLVEDNMANAIFLEAVKKGLDPRNFTLVVGGGAGPVHSVAVAAKLGIRQVYIPRQAAVFCAFGAALADHTYILNRFLYKRDDQVDLEEVKSLFDSLEEEGRAVLARQGVQPEDMRLIRGAEMRYYGQLNDVSVTVPNSDPGKGFSEDTLNELIRTFHDQHKTLFGWSNPAMPAVLAMLKLQAVGVRPPLTLPKRPVASEDVSTALKRRRSVYIKESGSFEETRCYDADLLRHGHRIEGPAIIEETKTTVVLPPGTELIVDAYENYLVSLAGEAEK